LTDDNGSPPRSSAVTLFCDSSHPPLRLQRDTTDALAPRSKRSKPTRGVGNSDDWDLYRSIAPISGKIRKRTPDGRRSSVGRSACGFSPSIEHRHLTRAGRLGSKQSSLVPGEGPVVNERPAFRHGGPNWCSCPIAVIGFRRPDRLKRVVCRHSQSVRLSTVRLSRVIEQTFSVGRVARAGVTAQLHGIYAVALLNTGRIAQQHGRVGKRGPRGGARSSVCWGEVRWYLNPDLAIIARGTGVIGDESVAA
jgi:hypothetical protein